jgi:pimeloyl-ACP methyl ester carboxylesterase
MVPGVNHHREGTGEPLVLIHGIGHHWQGWRPVIDQLAAEFELIAVDLPGFGKSPPLASGVTPTIPAYADAFAEFLEAEGLEQAHIAGNSMGGAIGLELARRGVGRSVTAISPAGFWTSGERRYVQVMLGAHARSPRRLQALNLSLVATRLGKALLFGIVFAKPALVPTEEARATLRDAWASPAFIPALEAFDEYTFRGGEELAEHTVTVAWGSRDRLLFYGRQAPRARRALPSARHVTLEGLGHTPFFDDPRATAQVIRETAARAG